VIEVSNKRDLLLQEEKFGYQGVHYLVALREQRTSLPEYKRFGGLIAEIQVRTILQHAWAEIEHDIQYKSVETIPLPLRRRFMSLAGLLEIADREFQAVQDEDERLRAEARALISQGQLERVEITGDALKAYLDRKLGPDGRVSPFVYEFTAEALRALGFKNFHQIDECIVHYDDDALSKLVWGARQGQITRFEIQLLAGMGEYFMKNYMFSDEEWWVAASSAKLQIMRDNDVKIRSYVPNGKTK